MWILFMQIFPTLNKRNVQVKDQVYLNLFTSLLGASEYATVMILHSGRRLLGTAWLLPHLFFNLSHWEKNGEMTLFVV